MAHYDDDYDIPFPSPINQLTIHTLQRTKKKDSFFRNLDAYQFMDYANLIN